MVYVHVSGGLGNQLFQFSAGYALSKRLGCHLRLDTSSFGGRFNTSTKNKLYHTSRQFALTTLLGSSVTQVQEYSSWDLTVDRMRRLYRLSLQTPYRFGLPIWQTSKHFDPRFFHIRKPVYLKGVFPSFQYFFDIKDEINQCIIQAFLLKSERAKRISYEVRSQISCAVHIRRGDYLTNPNVNKKYVTLGAQYYDYAMSLIKEMYGNVRFFVFSDDIESAKDVVSRDWPVYFVAPGCQIEDLMLMAQCNANITANSTFSWWSAWLDLREEGTVICPKRWRKDGAEMVDIPDKWIQI